MRKFLNLVHKHRLMAKIILYFILIGAIILVYWKLNPDLGALGIFKQMFENEAAVSVLAIGIISMLFTIFTQFVGKLMEDKIKTSNDQHKIIHLYAKHRAPNYAKARKDDMETLKRVKNIRKLHYAKRMKKFIKKDYELRCKQYGPDEKPVAISYLPNSRVEIIEGQKHGESYFLALQSHTQPSSKLKIDSDVYRGDYYEDLVDWLYFADPNQPNFQLIELPSVNVYANVNGKTEICFHDSDEEFELPEAILENADKLMAAHAHSNVSNSTTVRLNNVKVEYLDAEDHVTENEEQAVKERFVLETMRTQYFHMLMTNRCMDYPFGPQMTVRKILEYQSKISPLEESKLSNQIGINGLVLTSDGYVLLEKRDRSKSTWKNKFAQPISLAMKRSDLKLAEGETVIKDGAQDAYKCISNIITGTLKKNYGLLPKDYTFSIQENFLGFARDLLEGGKPNLYFCVFTTLTAKELQNVIEQTASNVSAAEGGAPGALVLDRAKLTSDYYLVKWDKVGVDYDYKMSISLRSEDVIRINRHASARKVFKAMNPGKKVPHLKSRSKLRARMWDNMRKGANWIFHPHYKRECCEALLVCIAYMELCENRMSILQDQVAQKARKEG